MTELRYRIGVVLPQEASEAIDFLREMFTSISGGITLYEQTGCWSKNGVICELGYYVFCAYSDFSLKQKLLDAIAYAGILAKQEALFIEEYNPEYRSYVTSPFELKPNALEELEGEWTISCFQCGQEFKIQIDEARLKLLRNYGYFEVTCPNPNCSSGPIPTKTQIKLALRDFFRGKLQL